RNFDTDSGLRASAGQPKQTGGADPLYSEYRGTGAVHFSECNQLQQRRSPMKSQRRDAQGRRLGHSIPDVWRYSRGVKEALFAELSAWLAQAGLAGMSETDIVSGFCDRCVAAGLLLA